jgi:phage shock protein E
MFNDIRKMLGMKPAADFGELMKNGAQVVDVRSRDEYASGHMKGSINIPLHELDKSLAKITKSKPVIVCCASGVRSSSAKNLLETKGFEVHNGGGWLNLQSKAK